MNGRCESINYDQLERLCRRALLERSLSELEFVIANVVLDYSYALGVPRARFKRQKYLALVSGLRKSKVTIVVDRLEALRVFLAVDRREGVWTCEFCPDPEQWRVSHRIGSDCRPHAMAIAEWLRKINTPVAEEQPELLPPELTLDDAFGEVCRETAVANWKDQTEVSERVRASLASVEADPRGPRKIDGVEPVTESVTRVTERITASDACSAVAEKETSRARYESQIVQTGESYESRSFVAASKSIHRFADEEKNRIFDRLRNLDTAGELLDERCRRTWIGRVRDFHKLILRAIDQVKEETCRGKRYERPLGRVFVLARELARKSGRRM